MQDHRIPTIVLNQTGIGHSAAWRNESIPKQNRQHAQESACYIIWRPLSSKDSSAAAITVGTHDADSVSRPKPAPESILFESDKQIPDMAARAASNRAGMK